MSFFMLFLANMFSFEFFLNLYTFFTSILFLRQWGTTKHNLAYVNIQHIKVLFKTN